MERSVNPLIRLTFVTKLAQNISATPDTGYSFFNWNTPQIVTVSAVDDTINGNGGVSELRVIMPKKWWKEWSVGSYDLVLENKIGLTSKSIKLARDINTSPTVLADTFNLTSGKKFYLLDVLANDSDAESDSVKICFYKQRNNGEEKVVYAAITEKNGRVRYDKKSGKIKYIPHRDLSGAFSDSFSYTLNDGHSTTLPTRQKVIIIMK